MERDTIICGLYSFQAANSINPRGGCILTFIWQAIGVPFYSCSFWSKFYHYQQIHYKNTFKASKLRSSNRTANNAFSRTALCFQRLKKYRRRRDQRAKNQYFCRMSNSWQWNSEWSLFLLAGPRLKQILQTGNHENRLQQSGLPQIATAVLVLDILHLLNPAPTASARVYCISDTPISASVQSSW